MQMILEGRIWKARLTRNNNLRQHCHRLASCFKRKQFVDLKEICAPLFRILEAKSRIFHDLHPQQLPLVEAVLRLGVYKTCWVRAPEHWQPDENQSALDQWADFLRHLMALYPVPKFMDSAWLTRGTLHHFERHCWCTFARGQSLRSVDGFPQSISKKVLHRALSSGQKNETLPTAIWKAELEAQQVSASLFTAVMRSRVPNELWRHELWSRLVAKFSTGCDAQADDFHTVTHALAHVSEERGSQQVENLMRLSLAVLIRNSRDALEGVSCSYRHTSPNTLSRSRSGGPGRHASGWAPMLGSEDIHPQHSKLHAPSPWRMEELCTPEALVEEGKVMGHCVAGYATRCRHGTSAIFSLRRHSPQTGAADVVFSYVTLEVNPGRRKIVQIRAYKNQPVNSSCMNMVRFWAQTNHLEI